MLSCGRPVGKDELLWSVSEVVWRVLTLTVSEKLIQRTPDVRFMEKASSCGLVVSGVYWLTLAALTPLRSADTGWLAILCRAMMGKTSHVVLRLLAILLAFRALRSVGLMAKDIMGW